MKCRTVLIYAAAIALPLGLATAQTSKSRAGYAKLGAPPTKTTSKPIMPKDSIGSHRASAAPPALASTTAGKTSSELSHLEHEDVKPTAAKNSKPKAVKVGTAKSAASSRGSGINASYQKPTVAKKR